MTAPVPIDSYWIHELKALAGKLSVLFVDDNAQLRKETSNLLSKFFFIVQCASSGEEGLQKYRTTPFDVVITDLRMDGMNGLEFCRQIRMIRPSQSIMVLSGYPESDQLMQLIELGVDRFVEKPLIPADFLPILAAVCRETIQNKNLLHQMWRERASLELVQTATFVFQSLQEARDLACTLATLCPEPERTLQGLMELFVNSVEHGNLGITYEEKSSLKKVDYWEREIEKRMKLPKNKHKVVQVDFKRVGNALNFLVEDMGEGFNFENYMQISKYRLFDNHGRGIALCNLVYFDELNYSPPGNRVEAVLYLK